MSFDIIKIPGFGRTDLKKAGLGPDAMMQLAIQLASAKVSGGDPPCSVYESCSTAIFRHGRTDVIRPVTEETRTFIRAKLAPKATSNCNTAYDMLKACSAKHSHLTQSAAKGIHVLPKINWPTYLHHHNLILIVAFTLPQI